LITAMILVFFDPDLSGDADLFIVCQQLKRLSLSALQIQLFGVFLLTRVRACFKRLDMSLRSRRRHGACGVNPRRKIVRPKAHEVGDSQLSAARFTGLTALKPDPGLQPSAFILGFMLTPASQAIEKSL